MPFCLHFHLPEYGSVWISEILFKIYLKDRSIILGVIEKKFATTVITCLQQICKISLPLLVKENGLRYIKFMLTVHLIKLKDVLND